MSLSGADTILLFDASKKPLPSKSIVLKYLQEHLPLQNQLATQFLCNDGDGIIIRARPP
jgi:hypothetical protein